MLTITLLELNITFCGNVKHEKRGQTTYQIINFRNGIIHVLHVIINLERLIIGEIRYEHNSTLSFIEYLFKKNCTRILPDNLIKDS